MIPSQNSSVGFIYCDLIMFLFVLEFGEGFSTVRASRYFATKVHGPYVSDWSKNSSVKSLLSFNERRLVFMHIFSSKSTAANILDVDVKLRDKDLFGQKHK